MSENTPTSGISADYAQRITDDLAANRSEQDRARAELTRLQDELVQLEEGEQILVKMQEVLGAAETPAPRKGKARKASVSVPAARRADLARTGHRVSRGPEGTEVRRRGGRGTDRGSPPAHDPGHRRAEHPRAGCRTWAARALQARTFRLLQPRPGRGRRDGRRNAGQVAEARRQVDDAAHGPAVTAFP